MVNDVVWKHSISPEARGQELRASLKVTQQREGDQGQHQTYHGTGNRVHQEGSPGSTHILGCHEALHGGLISAGRAEPPEGGTQNRTEGRYAYIRIQAEEWLGVPGWIPLGGKPAESAESNRYRSDYEQGSAEQ